MLPEFYVGPAYQLRDKDKMFILWEPSGAVSKAPKNAVFIRKTGTF